MQFNQVFLDQRTQGNAIENCLEGTTNSHSAESTERIPQVAQPLSYGRSEITLHFMSGKSETINGTRYLFPDFEEFQIIILKPRGSKAKSTKSDWQAYHLCGYKLADTIANGTLQKLIEMTQARLNALGKVELRHKVEQYRSLMQSAEP